MQPNGWHITVLIMLSAVSRAKYGIFPHGLHLRISSPLPGKSTKPEFLPQLEWYYRVSQPVFDWKVRSCAYRWVNITGGRWMRSSSVELLFSSRKNILFQLVYIHFLILNLLCLLLSIKGKLTLFMWLWQRAYYWFACSISSGCHCVRQHRLVKVTFVHSA